MDDIDVNYYCGRLEYVAFDADIPEDHFVRFVVSFVKQFLKFFKLNNEEFASADENNKTYSFVKLACLIYYAFAEGITEATKIEYNARYNKLYIYAANGIKPSYKTIQNFIDQWGDLFECLVTYTIIFAKIAELTGLEHVAFDGSIFKAANNKFNVFHREDVRTLIREVTGKKVTERELKKLHRPAKKFMKRLDLTNRKKLEILTTIDKRFDETGQNTVPANDSDAIHVTDKKGKRIVGYNIQAAVDYSTKMFCTILISNQATDHGLFPEIFTKMVDNIGIIPEVSSADSAYHDYETLLFLEDNNIKALIDNTRAAKLRNGNGSKKIFHKDNMGFDYENNTIICYANQPLFHQDTVFSINKNTGKLEVQYKYYNEEARAGCVFKHCCCKGKKRREVLVSGGELALKMEKSMVDYENIYEYMKRFSTVEPLYGVLKTFYHIDEMLTRGKGKNINKLNLCAGSFNLKRLYALLFDVIDSCVDWEDEFKQYHEETVKYLNEMNKDKLKVHYPMII